MTTNATLAVMLPILVWSFYRRIKRNISRQRLRLPRVLLSLVIFSVLVVVFTAQALPHPKLLAGIFGGLATGIPLAFLGLKLTRFETLESVQYYKPNLYLGMSLSLLLVGRIIYRVLVLTAQIPSLGNHPPQFMQSALTLYLFSLTAGYYLTYYSGVLWRSRQAENWSSIPYPPA
jgi:hypothetical protein